MHFQKQARRGYNQTHNIANGISKATGIHLSFNLKATRSHKTQTSMTQQQRLENTSGIFAVPRPQDLDGKGILLIDDVCTTGSTLTSAASAIVAAVPSA